jgi:hypothetical protein
MCDLLVDFEIEKDTFVTNFGNSTEVECAEGRVIVAATAFIGTADSNARAVAVQLTEGALASTCRIDPTGESGGGTTVTYYLTTARVATL